MTYIKEKRYVLITLRKQIGSQEKVAKDLEISRQYLGAMENGDRNPTVTLMSRMAAYFKEDGDKLFPDLFFKDKCHVTLQKPNTA